MTESNPFQAIRFRGLVFWVVVSGIITTVAITLIFAALGDADDPRALSIITMVPYVLALWWLHRKLRKHGLGLSSFLSERGYSTARVVTLAPLLIFLAIGSVWLVYQPLSRVYPEWVRERMASMDWVIRAPGEPYSIVTNLLNLVTVVLLAPIVEEFVFRGFLLHRWSAKWGLKTAIIASSLLFSLMHIDLVGKLVFGLVLTLIYLRTSSLVEPIVIHMLNNAIAMGSGLYSVYRPGRLGDTITKASESGWAGVMLALSLPPLLVFIRRNWPIQGAQLPPLPARVFADAKS